jgi:hypothetical protein
MDWWIDGLMERRVRRFPIYPFIQKSNYPFFLFWLWPVARIKQKPTAVASRGFLLNLFRSTSANGVGDYNDDDNQFSSL